MMIYNSITNDYFIYIFQKLKERAINLRPGFSAFCLTEPGNDHTGADRNGRQKPNTLAIYFMRPELTKLLDIYGRMVAAGEWHDYAIDHLKTEAVFSIFRRASEMPMYRIIKEPARAAQQGMWRIIGMDGRILKRGQDLNQLLRFFDRHLVKAVRS